MKRFPFLALLLAMAFSASSQTYPKQANVIRLLTYNISYARGNNNSISDVNTRQVAQVVKALNADIVTLQELDSASTSRGKRYLLKQIADYSGLSYNCIFGGVAAYDGGKIGSGMLVSTALPIVKTKILTLPGDEARSAVRVDFAKFSFMGTHFDLNDTKRAQGANIVTNELDYIRKPTFLGGDLNDSHRWSGSASCFSTLTSKFSIVSDTQGSSIPGRTDDALIDYLLFYDYKSSGITVVETHIVRSLTINGSTVDLGEVSDHYPVIVDILVPGYSGIDGVEADADDAIEVIASPKDDMVSFRSASPVCDAAVYAITGQCRRRVSAPAITSIDLSSLAGGVYIVEASNGRDIVRRKIVRK